MKLKKLSMLCIGVALASALPVVAMAATNYYYDEEDGIYYYYDDDDENTNYMDDVYPDYYYYYDYSTSYDYTIDDAYWQTSGNKAVAYWDKATDKTSYKVQLYRKTSSSYKKVGSIKSTSSDHYDFSSMIISEGAGTYYFTVYPSKGGTSYMEGSNSITIGSSGDITMDRLKNSTSTTTTTTTSGGPGTSIGWHRAADGVRWWYQESNTTYSANKWMYINNKWYHFDKDGYMQTGWFQNTATDNKWYYLDPTNGDMVTNTVINGCRIGADGAWIQ